MLLNTLCHSLRTESYLYFLRWGVDHATNETFSKAWLVLGQEKIQSTGELKDTPEGNCRPFPLLWRAPEIQLDCIPPSPGIPDRRAGILLLRTSPAQHLNASVHIRSSCLGLVIWGDRLSTIVSARSVRLAEWVCLRSPQSNSVA